MGTYYKVIANISINHEYFGGGSYSSAVLMPLPQTLLFFKNHRIILKKKNEGFTLLQEASDETNEAIITFETVILLFGVKLNDSHFQIRSGFNYDIRQEKLVIEVGLENNVHLTQSNILPIIHSASDVDFSSPIIVTDKTNGIIFDSRNDSLSQFNALDDAIYEINNKKVFKYNTDLNCDLVLIFTLAEEKENKDYTITLPAGSYRWRYQLLKKYHPAKTLKLVDENEIVFFEEQPSLISEKYIFISTAPVKLSQMVSSIISVYENETIVKKYLPLPEISNARFFATDDKSLVLEAYVTV